jgi:hypothetical protein
LYEAFQNTIHHGKTRPGLRDSLSPSGKFCDPKNMGEKQFKLSLIKGNLVTTEKKQEYHGK